MYPACIIFVTLWTFGLSTASNSGRQLFLHRFPTECKTPSPININTNNITCVNYSPLCIVASLDEDLTLVNTGKSIEAFKCKTKTNSYATGGILGKCKYQFEKVEFLWTDRENGACGTTVNGKGYQVEVVLYSFNSKYKTFSNALNYRDGILALVVPINIVCKHNKNFDCLAQKIKQIEEFGYSTSTSLVEVIRWFAVLEPNSHYYAYPGQYRDEITGEVYYSKTVLLLENNPCRYISHEQLKETFLRVKNFANKHFTNVQQRQCARPIVVEAKGTNLKVIESCYE